MSKLTLVIFTSDLKNEMLTGLEVVSREDCEKIELTIDDKTQVMLTDEQAIELANHLKYSVQSRHEKKQKLHYDHY